MPRSRHDDEVRHQPRPRRGEGADEWPQARDPYDGRRPAGRADGPLDALPPGFGMYPGFGLYPTAMGVYDPRRRDAARRLWDEPAHRHSDPGGRGFMDKAADEVASWFGDEEAEHRREVDHRGKGPRGYQRSDARILEDVHDRLYEDRAIDASDIDVTVEAGEVTLSGFVGSKFARRHAEDCADAVSGVGHVQNNLRVRSPAQRPPDPDNNA